MGDFEFLGGVLCLDFSNTVDWEGEEPVQSDRLGGYQDLLAWAEASGSLSRGDARLLRDAAALVPSGADRAFRYAREVRSLIHRVASGHARGQAPEPTLLAALNRQLTRVSRHMEIVPTGTGFSRKWQATGRDFDRPVWPALASVGDLLVSDDLKRLHECPGERCGWLFVDRSRPGTRRWCDMRTCGNRAKARRHYGRTARA